MYKKLRQIGTDPQPTSYQGEANEIKDRHGDSLETKSQTGNLF